MPFTRPLAALLLAAAAPAFAQSADPQPPKPAGEQVITPQVDRRDVKLPRFASNDISIGVFGGTYATANFGANAVTGLRLGYHITEDVFVEGTYGRSKVTDEAFRQIFPNGGVLPNPKETLSYYNVMAGWNILPGEVFFCVDFCGPVPGSLLPPGVPSTSALRMASVPAFIAS